ncbi:MAG: SMP-30/gluconolactonase/LRE family protein [Acidimicrobiia bacterium]|nr:SMP-30/gluconolactonase/LRE family protein [Acidimicrobiia bacterium]MDH4365190.1 SMP-30/gluconolactonase/LRE family protein [Acidimicrobiia bacterium]
MQRVTIELAMETVATGLRFPEGPVAMGDGSVLVVEIERGTLSRVAPDGAVDVVARCGGGPNGAAVGPDGKVWITNNGGFAWVNGMPTVQADDYTGGSIQRVDVATGEVETVYTHCGPHRLRGPNDLVFDHTGGFWFSDPGKRRHRDRDRGGLYYARADGSEIVEVIYPLNHPNGVGLSPNGDRVYVAETETARVFWWPLSGPGEIAGYRGPETRAHLLAGLPGWQWLDSLAVDAAGNVCVATIRNGGITVIPPDAADGATPIEHIPTGDPATTNICFGGPDRRTAWITASHSGRLLRTTWPRPGLPLAFG